MWLAGYKFNFPPVRREVQETTIGAQLCHIKEEVEEANEAYVGQDNTATADVLIELFDVIHACETALRMCAEELDSNNYPAIKARLYDAYVSTIEKNLCRDYYTKEMAQVLSTPSGD